ncbi:MAG: cold shock domain-containing protein [Planctomycetota bacterium]
MIEKVPENKPDDDDRPKRIRIAKKRLGKVRFVDSGGEYGFIEAEDFRDDVFFHYSCFEQDEASRAKTDSRGDASRRPPRSRGPAPSHKHRDAKHRDSRERASSGKLSEDLVQRTVEFEIDDELFETEQRLRAKVVRLSKRPMGRKLSGRDATFNIVTHHPKARRKRPDWRK